MKVRLTTNYSFALLFTVLICTSCTTRRQIQTDKFLPNEIPSATTEIVNAANPQRPASKEILDGMKISVVTFR